MKYLIATSHEDESDSDTITGPMEYDEAAELFEQITGYEAPRKLAPEEIYTHKVTTMREATLEEMVTVEKDGSKNLDAIVDEFSSERFQKAMTKAEREAEDPNDEEELHDLYWKNLIMFAIDDLLSYHEQEGNLRKSGVTSTGHIDYESLVPGKTVQDLL